MMPAGCCDTLVSLTLRDGESKEEQSRKVQFVPVMAF
eukprot:gene9261-29676_t